MRHWVFGWCLLLVAASPLALQAQTTRVKPPPGGAGYFGAADANSFTPASAFNIAEVPVPPPAPPAEEPAVAGDGVFATPAPPPKLWKGSFEAGLNGASGNSELINVRTGWNADRVTPTNIFHTDFLYAYGRQTGLLTQNQALFNARDEILFPGSSYTLFAATNIEYDELRAFHTRIGVYGGVGYILVNNDTTLFKIRGGAGAVYEIGEPENQWVPEMVFGYDFRYRIAKRHAFVSNLDYYPRIDDWSNFRINARAAYEIMIDPDIGLALRLGVQSRYDSDPGPNIRKNDLNYFTTLAFNF